MNYGTLADIETTGLSSENVLGFEEYCALAGCVRVSILEALEE